MSLVFLQKIKSVIAPTIAKVKVKFVQSSPLKFFGQSKQPSF